MTQRRVFVVMKGQCPDDWVEAVFTSDLAARLFCQDEEVKWRATLPDGQCLSGAPYRWEVREFPLRAK